MTLPRQVLPGTTYLLTRRVAQRQLLLTPSTTVNQALLYCLHRAAHSYGVELHAVQVLSNHLHLIATDTRGELPSFMAWLDRESAKCLNELYGRAESLWSSDHYSAVVLHDAESIIGKLVYVFVNCVQARLTRRYRDWPGVSSSPQDWHAAKRTVRRPELHFAKRDEALAEVEVNYTVPPALRDRELGTLIRSLDALVAEREREIAGQARRDGKAFLGEDRVRKQDPFGFPQTPHKKGKLSPTFAAGTAQGQRRARQMRTHFLSAYRHALQAWRDGLRAIFPAGTYGLVKLCKVCCAALETATPALDTG